jgi:peptidoglycan hydrolase-like protein with peptidoglycan-binding domain
VSFNLRDWPVSADRNSLNIDPALDVAGVTFPGGVKRGDAAVVLAYVATQFHRRVEPLISGWCWGWNFRPIRGTNSTPSRHGGGVAIDLNAPKHPLAKVGTFNPGQLAAINAILSEVDHVVRWGGAYVNRKDEMHWEVDADAAAVARVADRLRARGQSVAIPQKAPGPAEVAIVGGAGGTTQSDGVLRPGAKGAEVVGWQGELWRIGIGVGQHDGLFGPAVEGGTLDLQRAAGPDVADDGQVGNATRDAARKVPTYPKAPGPDLPLCGPGAPALTIGAFQQRLADRGWRISVDNRYGDQTRDVVARFQQDANNRGYLVGRADGVGGPCTWIALWLAPVTR